MNRNLIIVLIGVGGVIILGLYLYFQQFHTWYYSYDNSDEPFDIGLFIDLLEERNDYDLVIERDPIEEWDLDEASEGVIFYNSISINSDSTHRAGIDSLVSLGYTLFVVNADNQDICEWSSFIHNTTEYECIVDSLVPHVKVEEDYYGEDSSFVVYDTLPVFKSRVREFNSTERITVSQPQTGAKATLALAYKNDTADLSGAPQRYMQQEKLIEQFPSAEALLIENDKPEHVVLFKTPKGNGEVVFLLSGGLLTNYFTSNPSNFEIVSAIGSELGKGPIVVDHYRGSSANPDEVDYGQMERSPMSFILSYPTLRWAWYILVAALGLFMLLKLYRRERIVPIINPPKNQSLEFAKSLGILQYKSSEEHLLLAKEITSQFRTWSRRRFKSNIELDAEYQELLTKMHPEMKKKIRELFFIFSQIEKNQIIDSEKLGTLYSTTRYIYNYV